jgi:deoxyribodipyrimidine photo-lyase
MTREVESTGLRAVLADKASLLARLACRPVTGADQGGYGRWGQALGLRQVWANAAGLQSWHDPGHGGWRKPCVPYPPASRPALIWFRDDLRLDDNPALHRAAAAGPLIALYLLEEGLEGAQVPGGAVRWWLHHALTALGTELEARGIVLLLARGDPRARVPQIAGLAGAGSVHWNRRYLPWTKGPDAQVKSALGEAGIEASSHAGLVLAEPWTVSTGSGGPYKVFTPYSRAMRPLADAAAREAVPVPSSLAGAPVGEALASHEWRRVLDQWQLTPRAPDWSGGLAAAWTPGEAGARSRLDRFVASGLKGYAGARNLPGRPGTSRLSPHLRFGEISPRRVWAAAASAAAADPGLSNDAFKFQTELAWRDFSWHLLHHFPTLPDANWKDSFDRFPWRCDPAGLRAWQRGQTGYPIVDAGMRELWTTGWMHNRVRMIVGSFLVKHLLVHWTEGEAWFRDTLVDADTANNAAGWQWISGCGADAAPYFRIFNPVAQGEKFDAEGVYVRRWIPELARLPDSVIHQPWTAPREILAHASVRLGSTYAEPVVDHAMARQRALDAYASLKVENA